MNSRERVRAVLKGERPDRIPVDLGATDCTGIHAAALDRLRKYLGLESRLVKVFEPMMMLGEVETDVLEALGCDVVGLHPPSTLLGYWNGDWKSWRLPDNTEVLVGKGLTVSYGQDGSIRAHPAGNEEAAPSARMPSRGWYLDPISRQGDLTDHLFDARFDYADQFPAFTDDLCRYYEETSEWLYRNTDYGIVGDCALGGLGDFMVLPAPWLENTPGIRNIDDWILAHYDHPSYVHEFFEMQTESALANLPLYREACGERICAIVMSGTDFGTQQGPLISPDFYREFYKPYHTRLNDWVHRHTPWKVLFHSCGSVVDFFEDFIEAGVDIVNPVQYTARGMDLDVLQRRFGDRLVFWGGGIDTQRILPFGTPDEVRDETRRTSSILSRGSYVCAAVHNIQGPTPVENIQAFFQAVHQREGEEEPDGKARAGGREKPD